MHVAALTKIRHIFQLQLLIEEALLGEFVRRRALLGTIHLESLRLNVGVADHPLRCKLGQLVMRKQVILVKLVLTTQAVHRMKRG